MFETPQKMFFYLTGLVVDSAAAVTEQKELMHNWVEFFIDTSAAVAGGSILTFMLFAINEWFYPNRNISGEWEAIELVEDSSRKELEGYVLKFKLHVLQKGYELEGSGEKISETPPDGKEYKYEPEKRVTVKFVGYIDKKFLSKTRIYINIIEFGRLRESRTCFRLIFRSANKLEGALISTAANSKGTVVLNKS